jgi:hypothetical protein
MGTLAEFLFNRTFLPFHHQTVKQDFIAWYYKAVQHHGIADEIDLDNSELIEKALQAATEAENYDENAEPIEYLDIFEEYLEKGRRILQYAIVVAVLTSSGAILSGIFLIQNIAGLILSSVGTVVGLSACAVGAFYYVISHQLRSSAKIMSMYNERLTEKPGHIHETDRDRNRLAAKFIWNRSLCRPLTLQLILILSIIKLIWPPGYGDISGEIRYTIQDYVGKDGKEILQYQIDRAQQKLKGENDW